MAVSTVPDVVETLKQKQLLSPRRMAKLTRKLVRRHKEPQALVQDLVRRKWLTPKQSVQLFGIEAAPAAVPMGLPVPPAAVPVGGAVKAAPGGKAAAIPPAIPVGLPVSPDQVKKMQRRRRLKLGLIGMLFVGVIGTIIVLAMTGQLVTPPDPADVQYDAQTREAQEALAPLRARFNDPLANIEQLRMDLISFRKKYSHVMPGVSAAEMLTDLRSPLDLLQREIPEEELFSGVPQKTIRILGARRWRHWDKVTHVAFQRQGEYVVSAGNDGYVMLWMRKTGTVRSSKLLPKAKSLPFDANGEFVMLGDEQGKVHFWNVRKSQVGPVQGPVAAPTAMAISPNGDWAASAASDSSVKVWNTDDGELKVNLVGHRGKVLAIAPSANGQFLASGGEGGQILVSTNDGMDSTILQGANVPVRVVAISPGNTLIAAAGDDLMIRVYDLTKGEKGEQVAVLKGHEGAIVSLAFTGDSKFLASASADRSVHIWDISKGGSILKLEGHPVGQVNAVAFSSQILATAGDDGTIRIWDLIGSGNRKSISNQISSLAGHGAPLSGVAFIGDGTILATCSWDKTIKLWNVATARERTTLKGHEDTITTLAYSDKMGHLASGSVDGVLKWWDPEDAGEIKTFEHAAGIQDLAYSADGNLLGVAVSQSDAPGNAGQVKLYATQGYEEFANLAGHEAGISSVDFSLNGRVVYSASWDGTIKWQDWEGNEEGSLSDEAGGVYAIAVEPRGRVLASFNQKGQLKIWDLKTKQVRTTVPQQLGFVTGLAFAPNSKILVSSHYDGWVYVWNALDGSRLDAIQLPGSVRGIDISPDSRHLATANANGTVYVIRLAEPKRAR